MSDPTTDTSLAIDPRPEPSTPELIDRARVNADLLRSYADNSAVIIEALALRLARANREKKEMARRLAELEARLGSPSMYAVPQAEPAKETP